VFLLVAFVYLVVEIAAFVVVADHIGVLLAVVLVLLISASGPLLVRRAGTGVVEHARQRIQRGETPNREVLDGVVLLLGGVLVCIPGFVGDVLGVLLLIGPVRHAVIRMAGRHLARRVSRATLGTFTLGSRGPVFRGRTSAPDPTIVDATTHDEPPHGGTPGYPYGGPPPSLLRDPDEGPRTSS
jgi:UPF0716 protein FxsA